MKKHDNYEALLSVEAGSTGAQGEGKKSSSCSAKWLLSIIIVILLLLSLVISSLFWAVYTKLTSEQLKIFDSTSVSDLEPLQSNDVFVDDLLLRLAAQQNETDRSIPRSSATGKSNENETEVRVEPILFVRDEPELWEPLATPLHSTTGTTETSHEFPEKAGDFASTSSADPETTTPRYEDAGKSGVDAFNYGTADTGAFKVNAWPRQPVEDEASSTTVANSLDEKLTTDEQPYHPSVSPQGGDVTVQTNTHSFLGDANSTVILDVAWDEQNSEMTLENLWDWLGSYTGRSQDSTTEQEADDEYSYDDLDYLDYYENSEEYEDTTDESQLIESSRWNDLVDALSMLRSESLWSYKDELFSDEDAATSIPSVLHDLRNYTDTLARGMSDAIASFWDDLPDALENEDVAAIGSYEPRIPEIGSSTEIASTPSSSDVEVVWTGTEMEPASGTSEAPVSFGDQRTGDATTESDDYYWYPDEEKLEKVDPYISDSYLGDLPDLSQAANREATTAARSVEEAGLSSSFGKAEEYDDELPDPEVSGNGDKTEPPRSDETEKAGADFSGQTEASVRSEQLEGSEIDRRAIQELADMLVSRNVPAPDPWILNGEPQLIEELVGMIAAIDDDDVRGMKMMDELLATLSDSKYNLNKELLDDIAAARDYLRLLSPFDSIFPTAVSESTKNSDDDSQKLAGTRSIAKRDVIRRRNELPPRLLRKKTPAEVFARTRRVRQIEENDAVATSFVDMRRDLLKETRDFYSKMELVANHIDGLQDRFYRRNQLDDDYVSKEMQDDEEDPRNL